MPVAGMRMYNVSLADDQPFIMLCNCFTSDGREPQSNRRVDMWMYKGTKTTTSIMVMTHVPLLAIDLLSHIASLSLPKYD
jgi:hypothetical protein